MTNNVQNLLKKFIFLRKVEEKIQEKYSEQEMRCPVHLTIGQEGTAVGVCEALNTEDIVFSGHRSHGPYIAKGGNLDKFFSEIYGKKTGCSGGRGGSMHLIDLDVNFYASTPIVGGVIPLATGAAFSINYKKENRISTVFFGDGSTEEGVFHESINFASLKKLPVLFICENNFYSVYTPINERQPKREISSIAKAHGLKVITVESNDPYDIYLATKELTAHIKKGLGPGFLEVKTYRFVEHCGPSPDDHLNYRLNSEISEWQKKDGLKLIKNRCLNDNLISEKEIEEYEKKCEFLIEKSIEKAKKDSFPKKEELNKHVYSDSNINFENPKKTDRTIKYAEAIREATEQIMDFDENVFIIGEGVPDPKGIFGTTTNLRKKFGADRVLDMPVSENGLTGMCIGAALLGLRPILTHQRLDFSLLSLDQIINNAAKFSYMFEGKLKVPLTIRMIIGRGWGQGAQHSQNLQALFSHIPGLKVVMPTNANDAKGLLISSVLDNNCIIYIEHRWLHNLIDYVPENIYKTDIGKCKIIKKGKDITVVSTSIMTLEAMKATSSLKNEFDIEHINVITLKPLDEDTILDSVKKTGRLLVLDSGHYSGGFAGEIISRVTEKMFSYLKTAPIRITLPDIPTPTSKGLTKYYYPNKNNIVNACYVLMNINKKIDVEENEHHDIPDKSFTGPF
ncbi:hypothetical protein K9L67_01145 [Candidatus Woesearchaeota archaeon]|nr:hypothetical protein [Candidatus Woesearchaeota archaeon]MCF7900809.1 hypothetical protein [Candidatus Woesearchaeota archaeon]MCF8013111.1 hypothetical protein [Candidatus Woesearchaeota archaeon]